MASPRTSRFPGGSSSPARMSPSRTRTTQGRNDSLGLTRSQSPGRSKTPPRYIVTAGPAPTDSRGKPLDWTGDGNEQRVYTQLNPAHEKYQQEKRQKAKAEMQAKSELDHRIAVLKKRQEYKKR